MRYQHGCTPAPTLTKDRGFGVVKYIKYLWLMAIVITLGVSCKKEVNAPVKVETIKKVAYTDPNGESYNYDDDYGLDGGGGKGGNKPLPADKPMGPGGSNGDGCNPCQLPAPR